MRIRDDNKNFIPEIFFCSYQKPSKFVDATKTT